jgi:isopentenyl diphosphate isomerase/L-lactate dehydrogenase-like FMN-dependent dehydrogenase
MLRPRVLADVTSIDTSVTLFGERFAFRSFSRRSRISGCFIRGVTRELIDRAFDTAIALLGKRSIDEIDRSVLW